MIFFQSYHKRNRNSHTNKYLVANIQQCCSAQPSCNAPQPTNRHPDAIPTIQSSFTTNIAWTLRCCPSVEIKFISNVYLLETNNAHEIKKLIKKCVLNVFIFVFVKFCHNRTMCYLSVSNHSNICHSKKRSNSVIYFYYFDFSPKSLISILDINYSGCNGDHAIYQTDGNFVSFNGEFYFSLFQLIPTDSQVLYARKGGGAPWSSDTTTAESASCT